MINNNIKLVVENRQVYATSREMAKDFEKEHDDLLGSIRDLIKNLTTENFGVKIEDYFIESLYVNSRNRKYPEYRLTKDGFTLLAMGFTGIKALQFKLDYINKFNEMEAQLKEIEKVIVDKGSLSEEEYYNIKFSTAQRVRNTFSNSEDIFEEYKKFTLYSRKSLDVAKRITRLNQIFDTLTKKEDDLYQSKVKGYRAERENIIELKEEILRDINEINNRSYGQKLGHATRKIS